MRNKLIAISFILIFASDYTGKGQKLVNSPFSRFNIGTLEEKGSFRSLSMGGVGTAMRDNSSIYYVNPSSYSSIDTTSFLFDFGMNYSTNVISDGTLKYHSDDMNFDHIIIGFPIVKGWGISAGITPFSNGYYNLFKTIKEGDPGYDPITGEINSFHNGSGSLNNFFIGTGLNITKKLSLGINLTFLFGQLERSNQFVFTDYANTFSESNSEKLRINGAALNYGLQYNTALKKDYFFTAGISVTPPKKYKDNLEKISVRFAPYLTSSYSPDTLYYSNTQSKDSTRFPSTIRLGVAFGKKDKFVAGIDYIISSWSHARIHGSNGYFADSKSWLMGVEYIPDKYSNNSYLSRIEYRLGGHISDNYLLINGVQIKEYGASCGLGLSLRNTLSKANIYFDFLRRKGNNAKGVHNENFYTVGISLNLYDWWFRKKQYE
jgi:hypothetical protein